MNIKKPDKTTLREQFETERQRLATEFTPPKKSWWMSSEKVTYKTTWEIANTPPYIQKNIDSLVVVNEKHSWIPMLGFIVFFILTFFANNNPEKDSVNFGVVLFFFFLVLLLGITIIHNADRSPKIVIDKKGICLCKINLQVIWERIVETYIKEDYNGEDTSYSLYIRYIDDKYLSFETAEIPISGFMQGFEEIAYAIEYIKKNASDFQRHFS
jgi:hypothetical protein